MTKEPPVSADALLEVFTPRDWDGLIVRYVQSVPGGPVTIEAWDPETQRWCPGNVDLRTMTRLPLATHDEMDDQGVPAADRTRLNPQRYGPDLRSIPRHKDGLIIRFLPRPGEPDLVEQWDKQARRWRPYDGERVLDRRNLATVPAIASTRVLDEQGVPEEDRIDPVPNFWDALRK